MKPSILFTFIWDKWLFCCSRVDDDAIDCECLCVFVSTGFVWGIQRPTNQQIYSSKEITMHTTMISKKDDPIESVLQGFRWIASMKMYPHLLILNLACGFLDKRNDY